MSALYENDALLSLTGGYLHPGGEVGTLRLLAAAGLAPGARVLDIGCGTGRAVALLRARGFDAHGIDRSEKLVQLAHSPYVTLGDGCNIARRYDALLLSCVLSLLGDTEAFLDKAAQALPAGGKLLVSEPYRKGAAGEGVPVPSCINGVPDEAGYRMLFSRAGFVCRAWMDETDAMRGFVAMLIMAFGSADAFLCEMTGGCARMPTGMRLGYASSVWEKL